MKYLDYTVAGTSSVRPVEQEVRSPLVNRRRDRTSDGQWFTDSDHAPVKNRRQTACRFCNGAEVTSLWG
jgi:hypothetical protein